MGDRPIDPEVLQHLRAIPPQVRQMMLPSDEWNELSPHDPRHVIVYGGRTWVGKTNGLRVSVSVDEINKVQWLHLSVSRKSRTPSYDDLVLVRRLCFGETEPAYMVFPRREEHRNFMPYCLHLWSCLGKAPFPDPLGERADTVGPRS